VVAKSTPLAKNSSDPLQSIRQKFTPTKSFPPGAGFVIAGAPPLPLEPPAPDVPLLPPVPPLAELPPFAVPPVEIDPPPPLT
jgi:hypothetical protein